MLMIFSGTACWWRTTTGPTRRGRSPVPLWLNPAYGGFLGVDLEALRVRTVLTDFAGDVVAQEEVGLRAGLDREAVLEIVVEAARQTARQAGDRRLFAVGVAAPGVWTCRGPHRPLRPAARLPRRPAARSDPAALRLPDLHGGEHPGADPGRAAPRGPAGDIATSSAWRPARGSAWAS